MLSLCRPVDNVFFWQVDLTSDSLHHFSVKCHNNLTRLVDLSENPIDLTGNHVHVTDITCMMTSRWQLGTLTWFKANTEFPHRSYGDFFLTSHHKDITSRYKVIKIRHLTFQKYTTVYIAMCWKSYICFIFNCIEFPW